MAKRISQYTFDEVEEALGNALKPDDNLDDKSGRPVQNRVVAEAIGKKQDQLNSGSNIKTINGQSVLGAGDISVGSEMDSVFSVVDGKICVTFNQ